MKYKDMKCLADKAVRLSQNNLRPELEFEMELNKRLKEELKRLRLIVLDKDAENSELQMDVQNLKHLLMQKPLIGGDEQLLEAVNDGHLRCVRCHAIPRECDCSEDDF